MYVQCLLDDCPVVTLVVLTGKLSKYVDKNYSYLVLFTQGSHIISALPAALVNNYCLDNCQVPI